jgi:hypothetical protein
MSNQLTPPPQPTPKYFPPDPFPTACFTMFNTSLSRYSLQITARCFCERSPCERVRLLSRILIAISCGPKTDAIFITAEKNE